MGIAQQKIAYGIGNAAWASKAQQEGLRAREHSEPERVIDQPQRPEVVSAEQLPDGQDGRIGALYYTWELPTIFAPAHSCLLLDKFFEGVTVGGSPLYSRTYVPSQIPREPVSPYLNLWKRLSKSGFDHNLCCSNGLVTAIMISKEPEQPVLLTARCAFGARSLIESDPGHWAIDWIDGDTVPIKEGNFQIVAGPVGGSLVSYPVTGFKLALACDVTPHFWGAQYPDRFSRGKAALSGEVVFREKTVEGETFAAALEASTTQGLEFDLGTNTFILTTVQFSAGQGSEDDSTRNQKFGFTGVCDPGADASAGFSMTMKARRPYTP